MKQRRTLGHPGLCLNAGILLLVTCTAHAAGETPEKDAQECRFCPQTAYDERRIEAGVIYLTSDDPDFGDAWGFDDKGYHLLGNGAWYYRNDDIGYLDLEVRNAGLDARHLSISGGQQGKFGLFLDYREIAHRSHDSADSPFLGTGSDTLTLPAGWVDGDATGNMPQLASSLRKVDIGYERERLGLGAHWTADRQWAGSVQVRQERKRGTGTMAGSFITRSTVLPAPVDYVTDSIESILGYSGREWHVQASYYASLFRNGDRALRWENPYSPLSPGADKGQSALPPDNQFHQVSLAGNYRPSATFGLSGMVTAGRMTQDERFLPASVNPNLVTALPRDSLDGEVNTLTGNLRLSYNPLRKLTLTGEYLYNIRDNDTPGDYWQQVVTDVFSGAVRRNIPYGFNQQQLRMSADMRINRANRLSVGAEHDVRKRHAQMIEETEEDSLWAKWRLKPAASLELFLNLSSSQRDGSDVELDPRIDPPENPRMRQYHLADRDRDQANLQFNIYSASTVQLGFGMTYSRDEYGRSPVGLQNGKQVDLSGTASYQPGEHWTSHMFLTRSEIDARIDNSQTFSNADWSARNSDRITTIGGGLMRSNLFSKLDVELEYTHTRAEGDITIFSGAPNPDFPALTSELHLFRSTSTWHFSPQLALRFGYWYEIFRTRDWALDNVTITTLPGTLHLDQTAPSYKAHVFSVSTEYQF